MSGAPHRRLNLLTGEWVLVSPHRMARPWQGEVAAAPASGAAAYDPGCYLCPGNMRANGARNPDYRGVFAFDNDFAALLPGADEAPPPDPLLVARPEAGRCRVLCYHPDHGRTMARMSVQEIAAVVDLWAEETAMLHAAGFAAVTVFENRGAMMGASNPHPHGQVWAQASVPDALAKEVAAQATFHAGHGAPLLAAYLRREEEAGERIVLTETHWVALVPFWAAWPFETVILPRAQAPDLPSLEAAARASLARLLQRLTAGYDRVFDAPFPYTMGVHQAPHGAEAPAFTVHLHVYPPLLRSATVRKHMVGYEMLAEPQRDLTPEAAAERLRAAAAG